MPLGQDVAQDMGIPNSYNSFPVDDVEEAMSYEPGSFSKPPTGTYNVQIGPFQLITKKTDQSGHWMKGYALNIVDPGEHEGKEIGQVIWSPEDNPGDRQEADRTAHEGRGTDHTLQPRTARG